MFLRVVRYVEWALGTITLTFLGVLFSLKELSSYGQVLLITATIIFFVASLIKQFDDAGWFKKSSVKKRQ
jgi:hypothetical protein